MSDVDPFLNDVVAATLGVRPPHTCPLQGMLQWDMEDSMAYEDREARLATVQVVFALWIVWRTCWEVTVLLVALARAGLVAFYLPTHTDTFGHKPALKTKVKLELQEFVSRMYSYKYSSAALLVAQLVHSFKKDTTLVLFYLYFDIFRTALDVAASGYDTFANHFRRAGISQEALGGADTAPKCCICYVNPTNRFVDPCGHTFCNSCMQRWSQTHNTCPFCVQPATRVLKMFHPCAISE